MAAGELWRGIRSDNGGCRKSSSGTVRLTSRTARLCIMGRGIETDGCGRSNFLVLSAFFPAGREKAASIWFSAPRAVSPSGTVPVVPEYGIVTASFPARSHVCRRPRRIGGPHSYPDKHVIVPISASFLSASLSSSLLRSRSSCIRAN